MPTRRSLLNRISRLTSGVRGAAEVGLAFVMTAGVAGCGGRTLTNPSDGGTGPDAEFDGNHVIVEAVAPDGGFVEAAQVEGGFVEAVSPDSGVIVEAVAPDSGPGPDGTFVEAAQVEGGFPDGAVEAVCTVCDAGDAQAIEGVVPDGSFFDAKKDAVAFDGGFDATTDGSASGDASAEDAASDASDAAKD